MSFYFKTECGNCGEDMFKGVIDLSPQEHNGRPVVDCDLLSQIRFECDNCDGVTYTGDFDDMCEHEEGAEPEDEEEDDEPDEGGE